MRIQPLPVQKPYVPVLMAGVGERLTLPSVAQYADAANFIPSSVPARRPSSTSTPCCASIAPGCGRPYDAVLRTYQFVPVLLADSAAALEAKREVVPPFLRAMDPQSTGGLVGTPEQAVDRLQALVSAGCQYFILSVLDFGTLHLLAERVIPGVLAT